MENASKALIISGAVLLAILVLTLGIYMYNVFTEPTEGYVKNLDTIELKKYNNPYEIFIGREDVTAQEIVSIVGNSKQRDSNITVNISNLTSEFQNMQLMSDAKLNDFLNDNIQYSEKDTSKLVYFKFINLEYDDEGKVKYIEFQKIGEKGEPPSQREPNIEYIEYNPDSDPTPEDNEPPTFVKTEYNFTNVKDNDGDLVMVGSKVWIYTVSEYNWKYEAQFARDPKTISEPSWKLVEQYQINYYDDYSSQSYKIGDGNKVSSGSGYGYGYGNNWNYGYRYGNYYSRTDWNIIIRVQYFAKDRYHDWQYSDYYYKVNKCPGGTEITETTIEGYKTITQITGGGTQYYNFDPGSDAPNAKCPNCGKTGKHSCEIAGSSSGTTKEEVEVPIYKTIVKGIDPCIHGYESASKHQWW